MDNWKHRSSSMKCATCMYFVPKTNSKGMALLGRCRRNAPTMKGFPVVFVDDWCGEHKIDEEHFARTQHNDSCDGGTPTALLAKAEPPPAQ